jgi:hypothetical protein
MSGQSILKRAGCEAALPSVRGASVKRIERQHPGWKVAAGPYQCDEEGKGPWREERRQAALALRTHQQAGTEAKLIKVEGLVYVLRSEIGWIYTASGGAEPRVITPEMLRCPVCGCGPFFEKGLRIHGCKLKPRVTLNGRERCGRLDNDEIDLAKEQARARMKQAGSLSHGHLSRGEVAA